MTTSSSKTSTSTSTQPQVSKPTDSSCSRTTEHISNTHFQSTFPKTSKKHTVASRSKGVSADIGLAAFPPAIPRHFLRVYPGVIG